MKELHNALLKVQQELKTIQQDAKGNFGNYASLEQVLEKSEEVLHKHGLLLTQVGEVVGGQNVLTTSIIHVETGQEKKSSFLLVTDKPGPQGLGSSITYLRRYQPLGLLGKATTDDPDVYQEARTIPKEKGTRQEATSRKGAASEYSVEDRFIANSPFKPGGGLLWERGTRYKDVPTKDLAAHATRLRGKPLLNTYEETFLKDFAELKFVAGTAGDENEPGRDYVEREPDDLATRFGR